MRAEYGRLRSYAGLEYRFRVVAQSMTYQALPFKYSKYGFDYCCGWCGQWQIEEEA